MNRIKFLEIRDRNTFIPALAVDCSLSGDAFADYLLRRAGYGEYRCILLTQLSGGERAFCDPYDWHDRTWRVVHLYVSEHWDEIADADVIDVEFILGERPEPKKSERHIVGA